MHLDEGGPVTHLRPLKPSLAPFIGGGLGGSSTWNSSCWEELPLVTAAAWSNTPCVCGGTLLVVEREGLVGGKQGSKVSIEGIRFSVY